ncbi:MAG: hypoxanthine phosphoribosyltransferase [Planctomycetes bacterium]|nr:hypoxanthine phosphoribosyltransferase [Planctomycetota bacterium]
MQDTLVVLISQQEIKKRVGELASLIQKDYRCKNPLLIGILKGAFVFLADLVREIKIPVECDFIQVSSYGNGTVSSGKIKLKTRRFDAIKGKDIIIIDDIVDTGLTMDFLMKRLKSFSPRSIRLCALLDKPSRRRVKIKIDYYGFKTPDKFIIGYGLDYKGQYRNLPYVGYLDSKKIK